MSSGSRSAQGGPRVALRVTSLSKTFGLTRALTDVDLEVRSGEVHALVGGNGSGKSTLIKILAGVYKADNGSGLEIWDRKVPLSGYSAKDAYDAGLLFVHQDAPVFPDLSVAENLAVGSGYPTGPLANVRWGELHRRTAQILRRFEIDATPRTRLAALSPAMRMMVVIARALQDQEESALSVLVLDEPTASLPAHEVDILRSAIRRYAEQGQTIVYVSHRLDEVLALADRISVLRDGIMAKTAESDTMTEDRLIELVAGRPLDRLYPDMPQPARADVVLELAGVATGPLREIDLRVYRHEIVGIAGLLGSGRSELLGALFGALPIGEGQVHLDGRSTRFRNPRDAMEAGIALIPEDRGASAAFADLSIQHNLSAAQLTRYWSRLWMQGRDERADATASVGEFRIKAPRVGAPLSTLSGGNQQKVILARWLRRRPRVLLLDEPTQGVDVGARAEIYGLVRAALVDGACALVVSSDLEELAHVCDRVVVLSGGRIVAQITPPELDAVRLAELMYTATKEAA